MKKTLTFGEKMREWRRARKEYFEEIKKKLKEKAEIKDNYPPIPPTQENKVFIISPTQETEIVTGETGAIPQPRNKIEEAINLLREKARTLG